MGSQARQTRRTKKKLLCHIPIVLPASKSSYKEKAIGENFYDWVNGSWAQHVAPPPFESSFGVSEEVERCIVSASKKILNSEKCPRMYKDFRDSCMNAGHTSVEYLKEILQEVSCIKTPDDVFKAFADLCKRGYPSIFSIAYEIDADRTTRLSINDAVPGLNPSYYTDHEIIRHYKVLMEKLAEAFGMDLPKIFNLESSLVNKNNDVSSEVKLKIRGSRLENKFPRIPWALWFSVLGIEGWRSMTLYYTSPRWIRYIGNTVRQVPLEYWRLYLARCHIINNLMYLPAPFCDLHFNFFGKIINGQKEKVPREELFVQTVFDLLIEDFSRIFWDATGEPALVGEIADFAQTLVDGAKQRIETTEWLMYKTRLAAIKKVGNMSIQTVRPAAWAAPVQIKLDPANFLKNIFSLRENAFKVVVSRIGKPYTFWSEGIYRVNAYYFNENNEMIIPYGSCIAPFYSKSAPPAWNYGALGGIIGHEMCHGFDEEGKEFNEWGERKRWWTRHDNTAYSRKTKALIALYHRQTVVNTHHARHHIDGKNTLSENIADLGGLGIALQSLKDYLRIHYITDPEVIKKEYKTFFCAYATSWRTKIPTVKLIHSLGADPHAPPELRVNLIVAQFDEWYAAFDIDANAPMFIEPQDRIRIF